MDLQQWVKDLSQAIQYVVRQGEPVKVNQWKIQKNSITGEFITPDRQRFDFRITPNGFSSQLNKTRTDAFIEGLILQRAPRHSIRGIEFATGLLMRQDSTRQCRGKSSQPCGRTCISDKHECHVDSPQAKRVAQRLIAQAQGLSVGSSIPTATPRNEAAIAKRLKLVEDELRQLETHEEIVVVGKNGEVITRLVGDENSVGIPPEVMGQLEGNVLTHNHPTWDYPEGDPRLEGRSLSMPDLRTASAFNVAEMRAVSPGYSYSLKPGPNGWGQYEGNIQVEYARNSIEVHSELTNKIRKGEITAEQAEQNFQGMIVERTAKKFGWEYKAEKRKISKAEYAKAAKRVKRNGIPTGLPGSKETADYAVAEVNATAMAALSYIGGKVAKGAFLMAGAVALYNAYKEAEKQPEAEQVQRKQAAFDRFKQQSQQRQVGRGR